MLTIAVFGIIIIIIIIILVVVVIWPGALCMAELGTFILESGGEHAYLKAAFGPALTFLFDWTFTLMLKPSSLAIVSLTCAEYLTVPFFDDDCGSPPELIMKLLAACVICEPTFKKKVIC